MRGGRRSSAGRGKFDAQIKVNGAHGRATKKKKKKATKKSAARRPGSGVAASCSPLNTPGPLSAPASSAMAPVASVAGSTVATSSGAVSPQDTSKIFQDFTAFSGKYRRGANNGVPGAQARAISHSVPATPVNGTQPNGKRMAGPATIREGQEGFDVGPRSKARKVAGSPGGKDAQAQQAQGAQGARGSRKGLLAAAANRRASAAGFAESPQSTQATQTQSQPNPSTQTSAAPADFGLDHQGTHSFLQDFSTGANDLFDFDSLLGTDAQGAGAGAGGSGLKEVFNWGESVEHEM